MGRDHRRFTVSDVAEAQSTRLRRRRRWYFALMGIWLALVGGARKLNSFGGEK
jgi:hypothetical protein